MLAGDQSLVTQQTGSEENIGKGGEYCEGVKSHEKPHIRDDPHNDMRAKVRHTAKSHADEQRN